MAARHSWSTVGVGALALAIASTVAWWLYRAIQKRELQQDVVALAQDSTVRLRETLGLLAAGPEARPKLEAHFSVLEGSVGKTQALDRSLSPELVRAAHAYVTDVHALLRRQLALHAGRDAVHGDIGQINHHLRAAGNRSPAWIHHALVLNQRLQRSFFDYRLAAGGLEKSLDSLRDTGPMLRTLVPATVVIEEEPVSAARKRLLELSAQMEQQVAGARTLPGS
jgi:hypothetical protein